jgi:hypothetical protein
MKVNEALARPARTGLQAGVAAVIVEFVDSFFYDMDDRQYFAAIGLLTLVLSFIQTLTENKTGKAILRNVPPRETPVVDEGRNEMKKNEYGVVVPGWFWVVALVLLILIFLIVAGIIKV